MCVERTKNKCEGPRLQRAPIPGLGETCMLDSGVRQPACSVPNVEPHGPDKALYMTATRKSTERRTLQQQPRHVRNVPTIVLLRYRIVNVVPPTACEQCAGCTPNPHLQQQQLLRVSAVRCGALTAARLTALQVHAQPVVRQHLSHNASHTHLITIKPSSIDADLHALHMEPSPHCHMHRGPLVRAQMQVWKRPGPARHTRISVIAANAAVGTCLLPLHLRMRPLKHKS